MSDGVTSVPGPVAGIAWPPIVGTGRRGLAALVDWLQSSQWLPAEELLAQGLRQLAVTAAFCAEQSPYFAERLRHAGLEPADLGRMEGLRSLPPMTRRDIQVAGDALYCSAVPEAHHPIHEVFSSGTTGQPIVARRTEVAQVIWYAYGMRDHLWHRRDFSLRFLSIRAGVAKAVEHPDWGTPVSALFPSGRGLGMPIGIPVAEQAAGIRAFRPGVLLTMPTNLDMLIDEFGRTGGPPPGLRHLRTVSEPLSDTVRERARSFFGLGVEDTYAASDGGLIAIQCPDCGSYHVNAESMIVEVLNEAGEPCSEGEIGRIVITDFTNFAWPLIRYEISDYAEVASSSCGRGLPSIRRIVGRQRNLALLPDGRRYWPMTGSLRFRTLAPVIQAQAVQTDRHTIHFNLVVERPLTDEEETRLRDAVLAALGHPFSVVFDYHSEMLRPAANGKFEDFICRAT